MTGIKWKRMLAALCCAFIAISGGCANPSTSSGSSVSQESGIPASQEILLCPSNPQAAVSALEEAVALGEISEERINQSVRWILAMKVNRGVLKLEG